MISLWQGRRRRHLLIVALLAVVLTLVAIACWGRQDEPVAPPALSDASGQPLTITVYKTPTCGCCSAYEDYLRDNGLEVRSIKMDDLSDMKQNFGVPEEARSCHTSVLGDYFIEGHVPLEAIIRLLEERPAVDGIALPGMPPGSPGMGGEKDGPFTVYSVTDGQMAEFMVL